MAVGSISPRVTRSISPAIDFPSYTGSVIMPSVRAATRIASTVAASGMPYIPAWYRSSSSMSPSRTSRPAWMSSAVWRAIRLIWSRVSAGFADASIPSTRRGGAPASVSAAKPATMPAWVLPVTEQTTIVSKNTPSWRSCSATSKAQLANPRPPSGWSEAPAGIA